jgi:hypothetical protein
LEKERSGEREREREREMVAKTPPKKERRALVALNPNHVRETLKKVNLFKLVKFFDFFPGNLLNYKLDS